MGKIVTHPSLAIKIVTRDNYKGFKSSLESVYDDVTKGKLDPAIIVIDDSRNRENRQRNRDMLLKIFEKDSFSIYYLGRGEYAMAMAEAPSKTKQKMLLLIGMLGSETYQPSRAKNASQCVDAGSTYDLLLDGDVTIRSQGMSKGGIIGESLAKAKANDSYVSVRLKGFPDVSLVQLLERSIIRDGDRLHNWNEDDSPYSLSGGFLLYAREEDLPIFPNLYNEDFLWVAYGATRRHKKTAKLDLDVLHQPTNVKCFCLNRLAYEARGEISFATVNETVIEDMIENQTLPNSIEIKSAIREYREYIKHVMLLLRKHDQSTPLHSNYLGKVDLRECGKILSKHLEDIRGISYRTIQNLFENWVRYQNEWIKAKQAITGYVTEKATLSYSY